MVHGQWKLMMTKSSCCKTELTSRNQYHLIINTKHNKADPSLVSSIYVLKDSTGEIVNNACLMHYRITSGEKEVILKISSHGNSKHSDRPFYPTEKGCIIERKKMSIGKQQIMKRKTRNLVYFKDRPA